MTTSFLAKPKGLFINGAWQGGDHSFTTINPATGEILAEVVQGSEADIDEAVKAARSAFPAWAAMPAPQRSRLIYALADAIEAHAAEFAELDVLDAGKLLGEVLHFDIPMAVEHFRYYAGWPTKIYGKTIPASFPGALNYTVREPIGVVGAIIPWNMPLMMASWKLAPILAAGCTVVLKPAEQTPLSALRLAEIAQEIGIPPGVLNVVTGDGETGAALVAHPDVNIISFTGSTEVGKKIMRAAADQVKRVSLELGGKSANIIFADADLPQAIQWTWLGAFINQGQNCGAGSRILVQEDILDDFLSAFKTRTESIQLGNGMNPATQMGPLISRKHRDHVLSYIEAGHAGGGTIVTGGYVPQDHELSQGFYLAPTIFVANDLTHKIVREEIFGPVVAVIPFKSEEDAVRIANDTPYGLAGGVFTQNLGRGLRVASAIQAGSVWVNMYAPPSPTSPFGGYKQSGIGREMGEEAFDLFTEVKSILVNTL